MTLPYDSYPAVLSAITRISQGCTKSRACDEAGVTIHVFDARVRNDPQLQSMYMEAEQRGHDAMADALLQPDNHMLYGQTNPQMAKVMSDNIKWFLSKKRPKEYGERIEIKHEITLDRAITEAMDRAKARMHGGDIIDVTPETTTPAAITTGVVLDAIHYVTEDERIMAELLG